VSQNCILFLVLVVNFGVGVSLANQILGKNSVWNLRERREGEESGPLSVIGKNPLVVVVEVEVPSASPPHSPSTPLPLVLLVLDYKKISGKLALDMPEEIKHMPSCLVHVT